MQKSPVKPLFLLLLPILLFYTSCNDQKKATSLIKSKVFSQRINKEGITNIVATCPKGKQMVGGGYAVIVGSNINIRASYPSSKTTWQVDVESHEKPNAEEGTIQVYVYYYDGDKSLGMGLKFEEQTLTGPGLLAPVLNDLQVTSITKTAATHVVTGGGFMIEPGPGINDVSVIGSYPTLVNKPGTEDNVDGWTNSMFVGKGKTVKVINYILYSAGSPMVGGSIPVFDQGTAVVQNSPVATSTNTWQIDGKKDYFCTGGGYNLTKPGNEPFFPIGILQSNAITDAGLFFGWQFSTNMASTYKQDIYALQIKMH
jgi:hypothetical protein